MVLQQSKDWKKLKALTLMELLVVLAIIGIIILLALPNFMGVVSEARSLEAQQQLNHVYMLQKTHFFRHAKYSPNLDEIRFEQELLSTDGGKANYRIEIIQADASGFKAKAVAVVDFDGDGIMNEWEIDEKQALKELVRD